MVGKGKGPSFFAKYAPPGFRPPTEEEEEPEEEQEETEEETEGEDEPEGEGEGAPRVRSQTESSTFGELGSLPQPPPYEPLPIHHSGNTGYSGTYPYLRSPYDPPELGPSIPRAYTSPYPSSEEYSGSPSVNQPDPMPPPPMRRPYVDPRLGTVCIQTPRKTT